MEKNSGKQSATVWLRLVLGFGIVASVMALLLFVQPETASAAKEVTLNPGVKLVVIPDSCNLSVPFVKPIRVKISCTGYTPTPTETVTATSTPTSASYGEERSEQDSAEVERASQIKKTLGANKNLNVLPNGCTLKLNKNTASKVVVYCVPNPTPTMTPTNEPTKTPTVVKPTVVPPQPGIWVGVTSYGMPVSFEVHGDGKRIGQFSLRTYGNFIFGLWCRPYISSSGNVTINNNRFEVKSGTSFALGNFDSTTSASGTYKYNSPNNSVCGAFSESGTWSATP